MRAREEEEEEEQETGLFVEKPLATLPSYAHYESAPWHGDGIILGLIIPVTSSELSSLTYTAPGKHQSRCSRATQCTPDGAARRGRKQDVKPAGNEGGTNRKG